MLALESHLLPAAAEALAAAIESMESSDAVLNASGWQWQTAAYLATCIKSGNVSLEELRHHGLSQETAVDIATSIAKRHQRRAAALAALRPPAPKPAPAPEQLDSMTALSMLHTMFQEAERGRPACITVLMGAGWSASTARELKKIIDASLADRRTAAR
jgi:hypothetical protein